MKKNIPFVIMLLFCMASFESCINSVNNQLIIGKWKAVSWLENGTPNPAKSENTEFTFDDKEHYTFTHGGTEKKGTYKVENNMLFTTEEGMQEIMVNISKLSSDSLVFEMNNSGTPEQLILLRDK